MNPASRFRASRPGRSGAAPTSLARPFPQSPGIIFETARVILSSATDHLGFFKELDAEHNNFLLLGNEFLCTAY